MLSSAGTKPARASCGQCEESGPTGSCKMFTRMTARMVPALIVKGPWGGVEVERTVCVVD